MKKKGTDFFVVLFLVCAIPSALLLYNYLTLHKAPSLILWGIAVLGLLVFVLSAYIFTGIAKR